MDTNSPWSFSTKLIPASLSLPGLVLPPPFSARHVGSGSWYLAELPFFPGTQLICLCPGPQLRSQIPTLSRGRFQTGLLPDFPPPLLSLRILPPPTANVNKKIRPVVTGVSVQVFGHCVGWQRQAPACRWLLRCIAPSASSAALRLPLPPDCQIIFTDTVTAPE